MSGRLTYLSERFPQQETPWPQAFASGGHDRFERIMQRHHRRLRRVVSGMLGDPDRVDDVLQEAYLKAYRRLPRSFNDPAHEEGWLYQVVVRCCLDELRRGRRRLEVPTGEVELVHPSVDDGSVRLDIAHAFAGLSVDDRAVLLLVELVGLDYERAGRVLGVRRGTVASRLNTARRRFREALIREGVRDV